MRLRDDEFLGIRVETSTGRHVGKLVGFVIDTETGFVMQYRVRPKGIIAACVPNARELLIAHDQVVSMDARRMVVRDGAAGDTGSMQRKRMAPSMSPQPLSSESE
ncbi:MAG: PRC-barrel domain-containing protein [bacterium]|nr:PRC-barrel domain-containing protein [bacterium]